MKLEDVLENLKRWQRAGWTCEGIIAGQRERESRSMATTKPRRFVICDDPESTDPPLTGKEAVDLAQRISDALAGLREEGHEFTVVATVSMPIDPAKPLPSWICSSK